MIQERSEGIDVKTAVRIAVDFVKEIYSEEKLSNIGLEEVTLAEDVWRVTVGFSRPWSTPRGSIPPSLFPREHFPEREYKVVRVDATDGRVLGMELREAS